MNDGLLLSVVFFLTAIAINMITSMFEPSHVEKNPYERRTMLFGSRFVAGLLGLVYLRDWRAEYIVAAF